MSAVTITTNTGQKLKLGRIRPKSRPNALRFGAYLKEVGTTPPPATVDYSPKAAAALKEMYLNDQEGDCVIAGKAHLLGVWTGNEFGTPVVATDTEIQNAYQTICGPGDNGCNITDVLDYWKNKGMTLGGKLHKIDGYVSVDWTNKLEVQVAIFLFGGLTIGINLPSDWANNASPGFVWDVTSSGIVGGHDVTPLGYNAQGVQISTWGMVGTITWAAFMGTDHLEECYASLAADWYGNNNLAPSGVNVTDLQADLAKIGGGSIPPIGPPTPPSPPVVPPVTPPVTPPVVPPVVPPIVPPVPGAGSFQVSGLLTLSPTTFHTPVGISLPAWTTIVAFIAAEGPPAEKLLVDVATAVQAKNLGAIPQIITDFEAIIAAMPPTS